MWSLVGKNNPSKILYLKYCQTKREIYWNYRLVKKAMENKCWKEREREHTHCRKVDMCKWQMGDLDTRMKFSLSDCTWLEKIEYGFVFKTL
jgi:hypothetical protein